MNSRFFPNYDLILRTKSNTIQKNALRAKNKILINSIELNVPINTNKPKIKDLLTKLYPEEHLNSFKESKLRTLIQRKKRKLFSRNMYLKKSYKKVILTSRLYFSKKDRKG